MRGKVKKTKSIEDIVTENQYRLSIPDEYKNDKVYLLSLWLDLAKYDKFLSESSYSTDKEAEFRESILCDYNIYNVDLSHNLYVFRDSLNQW